jgi:hypothetical protein
MGRLTIRTLPDDKALGLARTLKERAPGLECRVCGGRDFGLIEDPGNDVRTILERQRLPSNPRSAEPIFQKLVSLVCTRCGHLEQFAEAVLLGSAKPEEYGNEGGDE